MRNEDEHGKLSDGEKVDILLRHLPGLGDRKYSY